MFITVLLFQEISQLSNVREVLSRSGQVATSVGSILDSFEHRLARLETTIFPLYQQTGTLQRRQLSKRPGLHQQCFTCQNIEGLMWTHLGHLGQR